MVLWQYTHILSHRGVDHHEELDSDSGLWRLGLLGDLNLELYLSFVGLNFELYLDFGELDLELELELDLDLDLELELDLELGLSQLTQR